MRRGCCLRRYSRFNTSIGPSHEVPALKNWLSKGNNWLICDTASAVGDDALLGDAHVICPNVSAGMTAQAYGLLTKKVLANIRAHLGLV